jgi:hypothetical protein
MFRVIQHSLAAQGIPLGSLCLRITSAKYPELGVEMSDLNPMRDIFAPPRRRSSKLTWSLLAEADSLPEHNVMYACQ